MTERTEPPISSASNATRLLWNPFLGEFTAMAPARMSRREGAATCPFCEDLTSGRVPAGTQAWIRPNDFPALQPPTGDCVILIYSAEHERTFAELSVPEVMRIFTLWRQVYDDFSSRYACVMTWETSGAAIGQTQRHPHGQTYGVSVIPDMLAREMVEVERAEAEGRGCPFCAELRETDGGPRVAFEGEHWLGFIPAYARYPYQVRLTPRQHSSSILGMPLYDASGEPSAPAVELAGALTRIVRAYNDAFQGPMPYMLALHQLADPRFHWHIELLPVGRAPGKLKLAASSEAAWGFWLNNSFPDVKGAELRSLLAGEPEPARTLSPALAGGVWPPAPTLTLPDPARRALAAYRQRYAPAPGEPITVAWAPGRINLIGEHTDYNEGYVLPVAIDRVVALAGQPRPAEEGHAARATTLYSLHHDEEASFAADRQALAEAAANQRIPLWSRYVRGVLAELAAQPMDLLAAPFAATIAGDVPAGGGMSSSAALEVATASFAAALGGPALPPLDTARACQLAEQRAVGAMVGILDQASSCLGREGKAILLDCRSLHYDYVPLYAPDLALAVYDSGVPHSHATSGYNERRRQCEEAVALLADAIHGAGDPREIRSLRDITEADLRRFGDRLPPVLLRRARHVVSENARTLAAVEALRAGQLEELGRLISASHVSLRDDYEVSVPELDTIVEVAQAIPGVLGARIMGGGFGGSALILTRREAVAALDATLAHEYPRQTGRQGRLHVCAVSGGPRHVVVVE